MSKETVVRIGDHRYKKQHQDAVDIFSKYSDIIGKLCDDRIITFDHQNGKLELTEANDDWFTTRLSKHECLELSELFKELANVTDEEEQL